MLRRILSWFRSSPRASDPADHAGPASAPAKPPVDPRAMTIDDVIREYIEAGDPIPPVPDRLGQLSESVMDQAVNVPAPPAFPAVAARVLSIVRVPDHDLNELVGVVQRDAALAASLLRVANSSALAAAAPVTNLRGAVQKLGTFEVLEVVMGQSGRGYYQIASRAELERFPTLWPRLADEAMANGFASGRLAMDVSGARSERALLGGLLADVGRPIALRVICGMVEAGEMPVDPAVALAVLDTVAAPIGARAIERMKLPDDVVAACAAGSEDTDARIAQLVAAVGAVQRRGPRVWDQAAVVRRYAEQLRLRPLAVRALFSQRKAYVDQAAQMFAT